MNGREPVTAAPPRGSPSEFLHTNANSIFPLLGFCCTVTFPGRPAGLQPPARLLNTCCYCRYTGTDCRSGPVCSCYYWSGWLRSVNQCFHSFTTFTLNIVCGFTSGFGQPPATSKSESVQGFTLLKSARFSPLPCWLPGWEQVPLRAWSQSAQQNKITIIR